MDPNAVRIYHLTALENLRGILEEGGLWAKNLLRRPYASAAYKHIQKERSKRAVPLGPGGVLHDYVPFFFCPRPPMLYAIEHPKPGQIIQYQGGQRGMVHLVSRVGRVVAAKLAFVFTDRHAKLDYAEFYADTAHLSTLDWQAIRARFWADPDKPEVRELKQAEFLVYRFFPWRLVEEVVVMEEGVARELRPLFQEFPDLRRPIRVQRNWYY